MEENWEEKLDQRCAWILVEMDMRDGLFEYHNIMMHGSVWWQRINYWKIPFRCFNCRRVGHLQKDCLTTFMKPIHKKVWVKKEKLIPMKAALDSSRIMETWRLKGNEA